MNRDTAYRRIRAAAQERGQERGQQLEAASVATGGGTRPGGETFCGVAAAVAVLGDAWTLLLVRDLAEGPRRFGELQASTGMSARVLSDRLHMMSETGLVTRQVFAEIPPRVEYTLTTKGLGAVRVVAALRAYGERWLRPA